MSWFLKTLGRVNPFGENAPAGILPQNPRTQQLLNKTQEQRNKEFATQQATKANLNERRNIAEALRKAQNAASLARQKANTSFKNQTPIPQTSQEQLRTIFETQEAKSKKMAKNLANGKIGGYRRSTRRSSRRSTRRKTHCKRRA